MKKLLMIFVCIVCCVCLFAEAVEEKKLFSQTELAYMPATEQIKLFKAGVITPEDVLEAQISRIEEYNGPVNTSKNIPEQYLEFNGKVNAVSEKFYEEARQAAKESTERYRNGTERPLEGITIGVKDENSVTGWRVDMGSFLLKDAPLCTEDCAIIERLRDAGAVFLIQTTVPEFYLIGMTWSKLYGVTRNPWNLYYGTGGSSGGTGAALAAGFCTLGTGSDMGGSIRIPASMCGVYGFKPPFGRVPTSEISYETLGPLTRTFDDMVLMQNIICGPSPKVHSSLRPKLDYPAQYDSLAGKKVAVCYFNGWSELGIDSQVKKAMDKAVESLKADGAEVDVIDLGWKTSKDFMSVFFNGLMSTEMSEMLTIIDPADDNISSYVKRLLSETEDIGPDKLVNATKLAMTLHDQVQKQVFEQGYEALVMPTVSTPYICADVGSSEDRVPVINGIKEEGDLFYMLTPLWNLMNRYPVVDVPVLLSDGKVPVGLQIVGNTYDDLKAFEVAQAISRHTDRLYTGDRIPDFRNEEYVR